VAIGDYHVAAGSSGLLQTTDGGDYGDSKEFSMNGSAGKFLSENLLLEGVAFLSSRSAEADNGNDTDATIAALGAGVRYYTDTQSTRRPYFGAAAGLAHVSFDDDGTGIDDSDTTPFLQVHGGLEAFLTNTVAVDLNLFLRDVLELELESAEDDITTFGLAVGLSIWF